MPSVTQVQAISKFGQIRLKSGQNQNLASPNAFDFLQLWYWIQLLFNFESVNVRHVEIALHTSEWS